MTKTSSRGVFVAIATASALILGGCAAETGTTEPAAPAAEVDPRSPEISELTVAGYPQGPFTPVIAATTAGVTADYGIDVTLQPAENAPAMLAQIISGDVPIGAVNGFFSVPAALGGADVRVIGEVIRGIPKGQTIEVLPDSGISSAKDLEGKTVAVVGINSGHHARVAKAVLLDGGDLSKVEFVSLTWAEMVPSLEQGTVDAIAVTGNFMFAAQNDLGTKTIIDLGDGPFKEFPDAQWLANGAWVDANPNTVAAFQCAIVLGGAKLVNEDRAVYEEALRAFGYSEDAIKADLKLIHPEANDPVQVIPDLMYELGWIDQEFDMASITVPLPTNC